MNKNQFKVFVRSITYNHSKFIKEAMDGFCMQQTDFPYICSIIDDASTDGEQKVLNDYLEYNFRVSEGYKKETEYAYVTFAQHNENRNCYFVVLLLKYNHYQKGIGWKKAQYIAEWRDNCKYEALCEGDDYWTDPKKLQKQVDFLDANPDYSMCFANAIEHWEDGRNEDKIFSNVQDREYSGVEIFKTWTVPTASVMHRMSVKDSDVYIKATQNKKFIYGDILLFLSCAHEGKLRGMSDIMTVYRKQPGGMTATYSPGHIKDQAYHSLEMYKVFGKKYRMISVRKFTIDGLDAFWGLKAKGIIDWKLLIDLFRYSPHVILRNMFLSLKGKIIK